MKVSHRTRILSSVIWKETDGLRAVIGLVSQDPVHPARCNGVGIVSATGMPISNSMAEMSTMQRYLQMTALMKPRIHCAASFGRSQPRYRPWLQPVVATRSKNTGELKLSPVQELTACKAM